MIRKTTKKELASNPTFGPFVRVKGNTIVDSGTRTGERTQSREWLADSVSLHPEERCEDLGDYGSG